MHDFLHSEVVGPNFPSPPYRYPQAKSNANGTQVSSDAHDRALLFNRKTHLHCPPLTSGQLNKLSTVLEALEQSIADHLGITRVGDVDLSDNTTRRHLADPRFSTGKRLDV